MASTQDPTPDEIRLACLEIQAGWTEAQRLSRLRADLRPTFVRCDGVTEEMTNDVYDRHHSEREAITCQK